MDIQEFDQEVRLEHYRSSVVVIRELGILALKTLITLNSGAFVVLLTFIGNTAAQSQFLVPLWNLKAAMFLFLAGISLSFIVIAYTYAISQSASPYPLLEKKTDGWFVPIAISLTGLGYLCFAFGVGIVVFGVGPAP